MSNSSFYSTTGATSNQEDAIEASVNNAAASETAAAASSATSTAQATISTDKATESAASAAAALVSKNAAASSSTSANTSKNSASVSASAASSSASAASGSASTASTKAAQALSSSNSSSSSASTSSTARDASIAAKNSSVTAQGLSEAARDASITAKTASETAETNAETAETNAAASSTTSTTKANESAASAAAALSSKNSSDTNSATATTKASEAASSATASAASATASAASATTSTASKDTAVAVTANFLGAHSSAPTATASGGALAVGMLYFDTTSDVLKVRASGGWINAGSSVNGTSARFAYTLTANQTTVSGNDTSGNALAYDSGFADVYLNGVKLAAADFTATSGSSIVLAAGATANDILEVVAFGTFQLSNGTFAGTTTVNNLTVTGTATAPTQAAGNDTTRLATTAFTQAAITALVGSVPATLNTLAELGDALGDDPNFASSTSNLIGTKLPLAGGALTGDVTFGDNNKAIFGAGSDLKIYHTGTDSIIQEAVNNRRFLIGGDEIVIRKGDLSEDMAKFIADGAVELYHNTVKTFETTSAGVTVTGSNFSVDATSGGRYFDFIVDSENSYLDVSHSLIFRTNGASSLGEKLRIESDGSLLVSPSSQTLQKRNDPAGWNIHGVSIGGTGLGAISANTTGVSHQLGRSEDGSVLDIRNSGSPIGSIGTTNGDVYIDSSGAQSGLRFEANDITPRRNGSEDTSGLISLGNSSKKFKDLYLSGGVYLGGTGAANKLSDYEEGIASLIVYGSTSGSTTYTQSSTYSLVKYTKIGRLVHVNFIMNGQSFPTFSGDVRVGLPFISRSGSAAECRSGDVYFYNADTWDNVSNFLGVVFRVQTNQSFGTFGLNQLDTNRQSTLASSNTSLSGASGIYMRFNITYETES